MLGGVRFQAVRSTEFLAASEDVTAKGLLAGVCPRVRFEMMGSGEGLLTAGSKAPEGTLPRVSANVLTKITDGVDVNEQNELADLYKLNNDCTQEVEVNSNCSLPEGGEIFGTSPLFVKVTVECLPSVESLKNAGKNRGDKLVEWF